jgi:hypothetical protein
MDIAKTMTYIPDTKMEFWTEIFQWPISNPGERASNDDWYLYLYIYYIIYIYETKMWYSEKYMRFSDYFVFLFTNLS